MIEIDLNKLKFPIGSFIKLDKIEATDVKEWIEDIEQFPKKLEAITSDLSIEQVNWKYRPNGWKIKQVIHHCADSHMNSFIRFKIALTEELPTVRPYYEAKWGELPDAVEDDISNSLFLLKGLHSKWCNLLKSMDAEQLERCFIHPEVEGKVQLKENIGIYAWHCRHHLAHIEQALKYGGRFN